MDFTEFKKTISLKFNEIIGIEISDEQCQKFFDFMNLLIEKNKVMNLTAIDEPNEIILRHFIDSAIIIKIFGKNIFDQKDVIDIGTGAGFPGIPIAIICPNGHFVLTDTLGKRITFLSEVVKQLKLDNVKLIKSRAEDLGRDLSYRESFDYVLSRAVSNLPTLSEYCLPFAKVGGKMLSFKMDDCDGELKDADNAIKVLGGKFHVKHPYEIIASEPKRCVLEIDKTKPTTKFYPRKAGTPSKNPIS